jgi:hypothetical protein
MLRRRVARVSSDSVGLVPRWSYYQRSVVFLASSRLSPMQTPLPLTKSGASRQQPCFRSSMFNSRAYNRPLTPLCANSWSKRPTGFTPLPPCPVGQSFPSRISLELNFALGSSSGRTSQNAPFKGASFRGAQFDGADFDGADLSSITISATTRLPKGSNATILSRY